MQRTQRLAPALALFAIGALAPSSYGAPQDPVPAPAPTPAPFAALTKATAKAKVHNQRVLVALSATGVDLVAAMKKDAALSRPLLYEFEVAAFTDSDAAALIAKLGLELAPEQRPALAVLDTEHKVLARLLPSDILVDGRVAGEEVLAKLKPHFCEPVDAEKKLAAAMADAAQSGRAIFVRFDAPW